MTTTAPTLAQHRNMLWRSLTPAQRVELRRVYRQWTTPRPVSDDGRWHARLYIAGMVSAFSKPWLAR